MTKKSTFVPAKDLSKLWRAIIEFDMLQPGDRFQADMQEYLKSEAKRS